MSKVDLENITYKKPIVFEGINQLIKVHKSEIIVGSPDPTSVPSPGDSSTGTGGQ